MAEELRKINGVEVISDNQFFKEFLIKLPIDTSKVLKDLEKQGILGGIDLKKWEMDGHLLVTVTEKRTKDEMDAYVSELRKILK